MTPPFGKPAALLLALIGAGSCFAQNASPTAEYNGVHLREAKAKPTGRLIVEWNRHARALSPSTRTKTATAITGISLKSALLSDDREVFTAEENADPSALEVAAEKLSRDAAVRFAAPEYWRKAHALTNDPLLPQQWYLLSDQPAATRTDAAWDVTEGSGTVIVAVLDSGVRADHPDLDGKLLPGYDFISHPIVANDGDQVRDADASDPGDWVTREDVQQSATDFLDEDCLSNGLTSPSSWHGTRVAGLIGAQTNNMTGVAGAAWNARILPVRVMGKCGGRDFDIMDGMRWAAGIAVDGQTNPHPAQVINLSLGGAGPCTSAYQATVDEITARGVLIVASAGNEGTAVSAPGNCEGVLAVAGIRHVGTKVGFSNLGSQVGISAPGGNCVNTAPNSDCVYSIVVATNAGTTTPAANSYTDARNFNVGTSFSAPMVASAAALLKAVNASLTPPQLSLLLKASATSFPSNPAVRTCTAPTFTSAPQVEECNCTTSTCGAGMLNTGAAVNAALRPLAVLRTTGAVAIGATIDVDGASSFGSAGRTIAAHQWSIVDVTGTAPTIANTGQASTTLHIPAHAQFTLRLTVTDDVGAQDTKEISMATPAPPPPPPAPPAAGISNGGGGGGSIQWHWLVLLAFAGLRRQSAATRRSGA